MKRLDKKDLLLSPKVVSDLTGGSSSDGENDSHTCGETLAGCDTPSKNGQCLTLEEESRVKGRALAALRRERNTLFRVHVRADRGLGEVPHFNGPLPPLSILYLSCKEPKQNAEPRPRAGRQCRQPFPFGRGAPAGIFLRRTVTKLSQSAQHTPLIAASLTRFSYAGSAQNKVFGRAFFKKLAGQGQSPCRSPQRAEHPGV